MDGLMGTKVNICVRVNAWVDGWVHVGGWVGGSVMDKPLFVANE